MNRLLFIGLYCLLLPELHAQVYQGLQVPFNLGRFGNTSPITQASGLALDPNGSSFWTHNDQGNPTTSIYKFLPATGNQAVTLQKEVNILSVTNLDWEDLAKDDNGNIYVCQIGKNCNENSDPEECPNRFVFKIHKIPLATLNHPDSTSVTPHTYYYKYPLSGYDVSNCQPDDTVFVNSEAAIWYQGALYVFTKNIWSKSTNNCGGWQEGYSYLFKVNLTEGSTMQNPIVATYKGKVNLKINPNEPTSKYQVTAAAISPDSTTLALTTYGRVWLFRHFTADSFFNGTSMYVEYSGTGSDTITRGYEGIEFKNNRFLDVCVDGLNGRISGILIDSVALWVKHAGDAGAGSLRNAIQCANTGDTLLFKPTIILDTIHLSSGRLIFNRNVCMIQSAGQHVYIQSGTSPVMDVSPETEIRLKNIRILCSDPNEEALINHGNLFLTDVQIEQINQLHHGISNLGFIQISGFCSLK